MRLVKHTEPGTHKLLHIETSGCTVNVTIGLHDLMGGEITSIEVVASEPDDERNVWVVEGQGSIVVRRLGRQMLAGDPAASVTELVVRNTATHG